MNLNRNLNPELEELRNSVPSPPNIEATLTDLVQKTNNIHAAFLFDVVGAKVLQKLSRCLSATKNSLYYSGWKELGIELELDPLLPKCIDNCIINGEDPASNTMLAYVQNDEATIDKILSALYKIKRPDVIFQTQDLVLEMCEKISQTYGNFNGREILKPVKRPKPPFILANLDNYNITSSVNNNNKHMNKKESDLMCKSAPETINPKPRKVYDKIVMLTYAEKDEKTAQEIARILRKDRHGKKIGVIILEEHKNKVYADPEKFITNLFAQSNFILPILTTDYLNAISNDQLIVNALSNIDSTYLKYIYTLFMNNYMRNGCKNAKIRCVIPDHLLDNVQKHPSMNNSEFRVWVKLSDMENLADRILSANI